MGTLIQGTKVFLPRKIATNHVLTKIVDTSDEWIWTRNGVKTRCFCGQNEQRLSRAVRRFVWYRRSQCVLLDFLFALDLGVWVDTFRQIRC